MEREKIEKIINELDKISQKNYNDDFILALYVYVRFGIFEFENYICDDELEGMNKILKQYDTIFDTDINEEIANILNDDIVG